MNTANTTIRVLIVDDHDGVRLGLRLALEEDESLEIVGEAEHGEAAVALCARLSPHVVIMDFIMPRMDGLEATRLIRQNNPNIQVIVLTSFENESSVQDVLAAGAIGYIAKNLSIDELIATIHRAYQGETTISDEFVQHNKSSASTNV